jgi:hypothetical protein
VTTARGGGHGPIPEIRINLNPAIAHAKAPSSPRNKKYKRIVQHPDHPPGASPNADNALKNLGELGALA